jgi:putative spermidine/putrescine transport system ATP-binding protein
MGFRNRISGVVTARQGELVTLDVEGAVLSGMAGGPAGESGGGVGTSAVAAVRPDDLLAVSETSSGLSAIVEAIEYRGRDYFGQARASGGAELFFRSSSRLGVGSAVRLGADASKVLIFTGANP